MMAAVSTEADGYAAFTVGEFDAVAYASKAIQVRRAFNKTGT